MKPVLRIDKKTGEVLERFPSMYAAKMAEMERNQVSVQHHCKDRTLGERRYCYRWEEGFDPSEDWEGKRNRPVWIIDSETGRIGWVANQPEAALVLSVSKQAVGDAVHRGYVVKGRYTLRLQRRLDEWSMFKKMIERNQDEVPQG